MGASRPGSRFAQQQKRDEKVQGGVWMARAIACRPLKHAMCTPLSFQVRAQRGRSFQCMQRGGVLPASAKKEGINYGCEGASAAAGALCALVACISTPLLPHPAAVWTGRDLCAGWRGRSGAGGWPAQWWCRHGARRPVAPPGGCSTTHAACRCRTAGGREAVRGEQGCSTAQKVGAEKALWSAGHVGVWRGARLPCLLLLALPSPTSGGGHSIGPLHNMHSKEAHAGVEARATGRVAPRGFLGRGLACGRSLESSSSGSCRSDRLCTRHSARRPSACGSGRQVGRGCGWEGAVGVEAAAVRPKCTPRCMHLEPAPQRSASLILAACRCHAPCWHGCPGRAAGRGASTPTCR